MAEIKTVGDSSCRAGGWQELPRVAACSATTRFYGITTDWLRAGPGLCLPEQDFHNSFICFDKRHKKPCTTSNPLHLPQEWTTDTYLDLKFEVLILALPAEDIAWNTNLNWVLQVVRICSQRARNHPLSKAYQTGRTKGNQNHSAANTQLGRREDDVFQEAKSPSEQESLFREMMVFFEREGLSLFHNKRPFL